MPWLRTPSDKFRKSYYNTEKIFLHYQKRKILKNGEEKNLRRFLQITKKLIPKNELFSGAGYEARTRYLDLGKVALYQMS